MDTDSKEINGEEVLRQLRDGSAVIDQMRREVENMVGMVFAFSGLGEPDADRFGVNVRFPIGSDYWEVKTDKFGHVQVSFWLAFFSHEVVYSRGGVHLSLENVQTVHDALPVFVKGMAQTFPSIIKRWQPLLDAAKRKRLVEKKPITIVVHRVDDKFGAYVDGPPTGKPETWAIASMVDAAVGELVRLWGVRLGIQIDYQG